jgi:uncharacterized protein YndB with AHSA1/START domain
LTDPGGRQWFRASPLGAVGDVYRLDVGEGSVVEGTIREVEPGRRFVHTWAWADALPRQETIVSWTIEPVTGGGGRITLVHDGWSEAGADSAARDDTGRTAGYLDLRVLAERSWPRRRDPGTDSTGLASVSGGHRRADARKAGSGA